MLSFGSTPINIWQALLSSSLAKADVPIGTVLPMLGEDCPKDYLKLNQVHTLSRSDFPKLFQQTKTFHGNGDGTTTFNLPNLSGLVIRGVGSQSFDGKQYDAYVGQRRSDNVGAHSHTYRSNENTTGARSNSGTGSDPAKKSFYDRSTSISGSGENHGADYALIFCARVK